MRKLATMLATILLILGGLFMSSPAYASDTLYGCSDYSVGGWGTVCVFDGTYFGKYYWQAYDIDYILSEPDNCLQLPSGDWNRFSSLVINTTDQAETQLFNYHIRFWPNNYCTGNPVPIYGMWENAEPDLRYTQWGNVSNVMNSISINP